MNLLQELLYISNTGLTLQEAEDLKKGGPLELKDVIEHFPGKYAKVMKVLWGTHRLVYKGQPFFTGKESTMEHTSADIGPAYRGVMKAAEKELKKMTVPIDVLVPGTDETEELDFKFTDDCQECYLGYDPKTDKLWVGYDCWVDYEGTWNKWSEQFDDDDKKIEKGLDKSWKELNSHGMMGALFELTSTDGKQYKAEEYDGNFEFRGFYNGIYRTSDFKRLKLVDLRLD